MLKFSLSTILTICISCIVSATNLTPEWALYGVKGLGFSDGLCVMIESGKYGYIDTSGAMAIPYQYAYATDFKGGTAIVRTDNGEGIIDTRGNYTLEPGNYEISSELKVPGYYTVTNKDLEKKALFDGYKFLCGFEFDYILFTQDTPFVSLSTKDPKGKRIVMNVRTGESFENASCSMPYYNLVEIDIKKGKKYYDREGEPVDMTPFEVSSKGLTLFADSISKRFGLKDTRTGDTVTSPRFYKPLRRHWYKDLLLLVDSVSPQNKNVPVVVNSAGKEILRGNGTWFTIKDYIIFEFDDAFQNFRYYDLSGREIPGLSGKKLFIELEGVKGMYYENGGTRAYNGITGKIYKDVKYPEVAEGVVVYTNPSNNKKYYLVIDTGAIIGPFDEASLFSEGLGAVEKGGKDYFVDKNGKEYRYDNLDFIGSFNEGVVRAYENTTTMSGYIYNPLGHNGWTYNQSTGKVEDFQYARVLNEANQKYEKKKYAQAMELYYKLIMLRPEESSAFYNYALCLYCLEDYDEALTAVDVYLNHWPDDSKAKNIKETIVNTIRERELALERAQQPTERSTSSIWDAIGNFANALMNITGGYVENDYYSTNYTGLSSYGDVNTYGSNSINSSNGFGYGASNYQSQYDRWASLAESHYNSLTNLGYSATLKSGNQKGGTGRSMSPGNYVMQKKALREAQREMRSIRQKAAKDGVTIQKSQWEDASVVY